MKKGPKPILMFLLGVIVSLAIGVSADTILNGKQIQYTSDKVEADNIQDAIDELYEKTIICSKICIRATQLHNDGTHTYGTISESGLNAGDAFDCDVNGNGIIDTDSNGYSTERFYYITDLTSNSNYAVLLYYNNTVNGVANNTGRIAYNSADVNNQGPVTAVTSLPTTSQWSNVSLSNTTRNITDENGTVVKSGFSYSGRAARFLTYQELKSACPNASTTEGSLDNCIYLLENTKYQNSSLLRGYWLESTHSTDRAWVVIGDYRDVSYNTVANTTLNGVRPAIEVLKSDISY